MPRLAYVHYYSSEYLAANGLTAPTRAEVVEVDGGYVCRVSPGLYGAEADVFWSAGATTFDTIEEALVAAFQYHAYPEVADYRGLDGVEV